MFVNAVFATILLFLAVRAEPTVIDVTTPASSNGTDEGSPRIVGGTNAQVGQFPYQVSLRIKGGHTCGGAIITTNYVLTAAHCVRRGNNAVSAALLTIRAGSIQRTAVDPNAVVENVAEVKVHPSYVANGFSFDVALLRLAKALTFSSRIAAIPLASADPPTSAEVLIAGFGRIAAGGPLSQQLLFARVRAITSAACRRFLFAVPNTVICLLHDRGTGACHGDSGGPAVANGQLIGVSSFIIGTCARRAPDGYARISVLRDWLISNSDL